MEFAISTPTLLPLLEHPRMIIAATTQIPLDTMQQQIGLIYLKQLDISEIFRQNCWTPIRPFQSSITNTLPPSWSHPSTKARWSIPSKPLSFETCETVSTLDGHLPAITGRGPSLSSGHGSNQVLRECWDVGISHIQIQGRKMTSNFDCLWDHYSLCITVFTVALIFISRNIQLNAFHCVHDTTEWTNLRCQCLKRYRWSQEWDPEWFWL